MFNFIVMKSKKTKPIKSEKSKVNKKEIKIFVDYIFKKYGKALSKLAHE